MPSTHDTVTRSDATGPTGTGYGCHPVVSGPVESLLVLTKK
jgi:hypothetical protein